MEDLNFVAIDFETATSKRSSICEIGITIVKNSTVVESKSWLVQPENNEYDDFNIYIHEITPAMTKNAPMFPEVWKEVEPYLNGNIVVAHNTSFDMYALRDALLLHNIPFPTFKYFCSYRIAKYTVINCYSYSLPNVCEALDIPFGTHHRAKEDSAACANVFIKCMNLAGVNSVNELPDKYSFRYGEFAAESFKPQLAKALSKSAIKSTIIGDPSKIDEGSYFYGKSVCFTGSFQYGIRTELLQKIADIGGIPVNSVTKKTDILIVGLQDFKKVGESGMSSKQKKAIDLKSSGVDIEIMSEPDFLENI